MKYAIAIVACLITAPAFAESLIILKLTRDEALTVRKAFDAAIRGGGADVAHAVVPLDDKLLAAAREAQDADLTEEARAKVKAADDAAKGKPR
jgi:hypothetical protein